MAAKKKAGKPLVIVESPAKARTIAKFLGKDFVIEASVGHIRDLPANAAEVPAAFKKEKWSRLGINIEEEFKPLYVVPKDKRDTIKRLKKLCKESDVVYLATDEDREGEAISWHLVQELKPKGEVRRLVFHEITKSAIQSALDNPRSINTDLVEAQETRRLVDRLYGYSVSPVLWKKIRPRLSAGRVQSVAVRLVVERERDRLRFVTAEYWDVRGMFRKDDQDPFGATLTHLDGKRLATGKDFDPDTGQLKAAKDKPAAELPVQLSEAEAKALVERLEGKPATVLSIEQKPFTERPAAPFTTSTLTQEASKKLGFSAKRTMRAAQRLYENGHITYMRTDSTTLSNEAIGAARKLIERSYGAENLPDSPRTYQTKVKNAQEAHEAIRPAGSTFDDPNALNGDMGSDERRLYELIWKRTVASQMKDAKGHRTTLALGIDDARFQTSGKTITFPGFRLAYVQGTNKDPKDASDKLLPNVDEGDTVATEELVAEGHSTKPPARLTEASLIKEMELLGIGRPSTYAAIIDTILRREFVFKKGTALVPTFTAFAVVNLMERHLNYLVDYAFTARMENDLDEISNGRQQRLEYLQGFYNGNGQPGLKGTLDEVEEKIDPREVCTLTEIDLGEGLSGSPIELRVGRYGPFLADGDVSATLPDGIAPDELDRETALDLLKKAAEGPKSLGTDPETGLKIYVKVGRYGPYFQRGDPESLGDEKPKMASLLADMDPETVTLDAALNVLALPREVGVAKTPETDDGKGGEELPILAHNGRFGPYLKWGTETRSIPPEDHLLTIGLQRALYLFSQPKRGGRQARKAKVLKELGKHPDTEAEVKVLDGRYGPYVTDGTTNATVPKGDSIEELTLNQAVDLLAERAAKGGGKKKKAKKKTAKKKTSTKKKATKKASSKKKATKKAKKKSAK